MLSNLIINQKFNYDLFIHIIVLMYGNSKWNEKVSEEIIDLPKRFSLKLLVKVFHVYEQN